MGTWTPEKLLALSAKDFAELWKNAESARSKGSVGADELLDLLSETGRSPMSGKTVKLDDPIGIAIRNIVHSGVGTEAMITATASGLPALAGIEPLFIEAIGKAYSSETEATMQAGYLVTGRMEALGYEKSGKSRPLPKGSVGRTGIVFQKKAK